jgi:hypothetical protein
MSIVDDLVAKAVEKCDRTIEYTFNFPNTKDPQQLIEEVIKSLYQSSHIPYLNISEIVIKENPWRLIFEASFYENYIMNKFISKDLCLVKDCKYYHGSSGYCSEHSQIYKEEDLQELQTIRKEEIKVIMNNTIAELQEIIQSPFPSQFRIEILLIVGDYDREDEDEGEEGEEEEEHEIIFHFDKIIA